MVAVFNRRFRFAVLVFSLSSIVLHASPQPRGSSPSSLSGSSSHSHPVPDARKRRRVVKKKTITKKKPRDDSSFEAFDTPDIEESHTSDELFGIVDDDDDDDPIPQFSPPPSLDESSRPRKARKKRKRKIKRLDPARIETYEREESGISKVDVTMRKRRRVKKKLPKARGYSTIDMEDPVQDADGVLTSSVGLNQRPFISRSSPRTVKKREKKQRAPEIRGDHTEQEATTLPTDEETFHPESVDDDPEQLDDTFPPTDKETPALPNKQTKKRRKRRRKTSKLDKPLHSTNALAGETYVNGGNSDNEKENGRRKSIVPLDVPVETDEASSSSSVPLDAPSTIDNTAATVAADSSKSLGTLSDDRAATPATPEHDNKTLSTTTANIETLETLSTSSITTLGVAESADAVADSSKESDEEETQHADLSMDANDVAEDSSDEETSEAESDDDDSDDDGAGPLMSETKDHEDSVSVGDEPSSARNYPAGGASEISDKVNEGIVTSKHNDEIVEEHSSEEEEDKEQEEEEDEHDRHVQFDDCEGEKGEDGADQGAEESNLNGAHESIVQGLSGKELKVENRDEDTEVIPVRKVPLQDDIKSTNALGSGTPISKNDILVSAVTWNLAEESPSEIDADFIKRCRQGHGTLEQGSDLVLFSGQECENIKPRRTEGSRSREFRRLMVRMLGSNYVPLALHLLGGIQFGLFCRREILGEIEQASVADVTCGVGNVFHNKGAIGCFVQMTSRGIGLVDGERRAKKTRFLFVAAHMAAHVKNSEARDSDFWRIMSELEAQATGFLPPRKGDSVTAPGSHLMKHVDKIFFCGDLNYRIELPREEVELCVLRMKASRTEKEKSVHRRRLLRHDQLRESIALERAFPGFSEGELRFPPTFKFDKGTDQYDTSHKQRVPAWTDRIVFKGDGIKALEYTSIGSSAHSDHRPVFGTFQVDMVGRILHRGKTQRTPGVGAHRV